MNDKEVDESFWEGLKKLGEALHERDNDLDKLAETCDYEMKIAVTRWVMKHIVAHAEEGGSYRYLIYDRLDFGPDAYAPLCRDGMTISNMFDLHLADEVAKVAKEHGYDMIKPVINLCDEPGCYDTVSCGFPTDDGGYRRTCSTHSDFKLNKE
jgi:hypothetical protein